MLRPALARLAAMPRMRLPRQQVSSRCSSTSARRRTEVRWVALALHAEAVPEGRRVDLRNFPAVAAELDRAILGVAIWSMITFDRVECTDTALVVHPSSQTLARVALWRAHAGSAAEAGRKAASTAQMLLGHGLNALRNFKRKDG